MAINIETPSRIWRRIQEGEAHEDDMPSLPSLPGFDDSGILPDKSLSISTRQTPNRTVTAARNTSLRRSANSSSTSRKEDGLVLPSRPSSGGYKTETTERRNIALEDDSLDISLPPQPVYTEDEVEIGSFDATEHSPSVGTLSRSRQVPGSEDDDDISLTEALASVSRTPSPVPPDPMLEKSGTVDSTENFTESALGPPNARVRFRLS